MTRTAKQRCHGWRWHCPFGLQLRGVGSDKMLIWDHQNVDRVFYQEI